MLAQLGPVQFHVQPINMHEIDHDSGASFAEHPVVGARPPLEFVGEAPESWLIRGQLHPKHFPGTLEELDQLHAMRRGGRAQFFMRGDGVPMGWVVILHIVERGTYLAKDGVAKVVMFDMTVKRTDAPSAAGMFAAFISLFS